MSKANRQKKAPNSNSRIFVRHKAVHLCYDANKNPNNSVKEVAKKMQLHPKFVKKWVDHYEKNGLIGYVGQRQSAILCIYKRNPNITLYQLRILLRKIGIIMSKNELANILKNLKPIVTDPKFQSTSEDQLLQKLKMVTKVQPKSVIRMSQKFFEDKKAESGEHSYALSTKSIFLDHNYVVNPELFFEENDYSIYDCVDRLIKYKTELMNKIMLVSESSEKLLTEEEISKASEKDDRNANNYKLSLLKEQFIYLCMEKKGHKLGYAESVKSLPIPEEFVHKWIEQAKSIKRFVHRRHVNKCCGKIQETIVRLLKLNPALTVNQIRDILHNVNIELSTLKLERQLDTIKYMLNCPDEELDNEIFEEISLSNQELVHCIQVLTTKINTDSDVSKKEKHKKMKKKKHDGNQISIQKIIESTPSDKHSQIPTKDINKRSEKDINENINQSSSNSKNTSENKLEKMRSKFQQELSYILHQRPSKRKINLDTIDVYNKKENIDDTNNNKNKKSTAVIISDVILNEKVVVEKINEQIKLLRNEKIKYKKKKPVTSNTTNPVKKEAENGDVNFLKYFSLTPVDSNWQNIQTNHSIVTDLQSTKRPYEDVIQSEESTSMDPETYVSDYSEQMSESSSNEELISLLENQLSMKSVSDCEEEKIDQCNVEEVMENNCKNEEYVVNECSLENKEEFTEENIIEEVVDNTVNESTLNNIIKLAEENINLTVNESNLENVLELIEENNINEVNAGITIANIENTSQLSEKNYMSKEVIECLVVKSNFENKLQSLNSKCTEEIIEIINDYESSYDSLLEPAEKNNIEDELIDSDVDEISAENMTKLSEEKILTNNSITSTNKKKEGNIDDDIMIIDEIETIPIKKSILYMPSNYKEKKRKFSEVDDIESEFEPIEDLSFTKQISDYDILMRKKAAVEKEIMTEYIECEDDSVVIKYWLAE